MQVYLLYLALFAIVAGLLAYSQHEGLATRQAAFNNADHKSHLSGEADEDGVEEDPSGLLHKADGVVANSFVESQATTLRNNYFAVYALVLAADWLQGPYIYSVYREDHGLPDSTIATLFGAGFVSAGISSSFLGILADKYGRRKACLGFCLVTTLSCLSVLAKDNLPLLFLGRMLGGISSTLLYSVFEAWMVTEHNSRNLAAALPLSDMLSWSSTLSGIVAIAAGVIGESLVFSTGTRTSPFFLAILLLGLAAIAMTRYWNENFGRSSKIKPDIEEKPGPCPFTPPQDQRKTARAEQTRLYVLGLATTIFEGSMFLFIFFWTPTLAAARTTGPAPFAAINDPLPLGLVFSNFMCAMVIGSMIFSHLSHSRTFHLAGTLVNVLAVAASTMLIPVLTQRETPTFWSFVLFELTVGIYFPTMGKLKSELVRDCVRAKVYTWMRLPLNLFVFGALAVTEEGCEHRSWVFNVLGGLLLVTALVVKRTLVS